MAQSIGYRLALDNSQYVSGMRSAQAEVRGLASATRSSNLGSISGALQMASGGLSTFSAGTLNARGGLGNLLTSMSSGGGAIGGLAAGFAGATVVISTFTAAVSASKLVLSTYAEFDSLVRGLKTVEGSASGTMERLKVLRDVAKLPGLGFEEAVRGDIRLRSAGISAETSEKALRGFGNALATVGAGKEELQGVILALSQIASKGRVSAQEINQLAERLPQIRVAMQSAFGTADTEALEKMGIASDVFIKTITEQFLKLPKVMGGAKTTLENYHDSWVDLKTTASSFGVAVAGSLINEVSAAFTHSANGLRAFRELLGMQTPGLEGQEKESAHLQEYKKKRQEKLAAEEAAQKAEAKAASDTATFWELKQQERAAFEKQQAEERVKLEEAAQEKIVAAGEKAWAARLSQQANLERQLRAKQAEGPSGAEAVDGAKDILVRETIATRTAEIFSLQRQIKDLQATAAEKAEREAEAAQRKAEAEEKVLAAREKAVDTFTAENAMLEARASGNKKLVDQLERQKAVEATKQSLMRDQGINASLAGRIAERRQLLEEAAAKREANPNRLRLESPEQTLARREAMKSAADKARDARRSGVEAAEDPALARREAMKSAADKAREARRNGVDAAKQAAAIAAAKKPDEKKDHAENISKKLDKLAAISNTLDKLNIAS